MSNGQLAHFFKIENMENDYYPNIYKLFKDINQEDSSTAYEQVQNSESNLQNDGANVKVLP